jgi:hypothetical protein
MAAEKAERSGEHWAEQMVCHWAERWASQLAADWAWKSDARKAEW